jgi:hypothetical protein
VRIQSNLNRWGSVKKNGGSRIKKANFGLIFGNFHIMFTNFLKKKGVPTPGTLPLDPPMHIICYSRNCQDSTRKAKNRIDAEFDGKLGSCVGPISKRSELKPVIQIT